MTVIIGIKAYSHENEIVLSADSQLTDVEDNKFPVSKITGFTKIATTNHWAMGFAGTYCPPLRTFYRNLKSEKGLETSIEIAVKNGYFEEVNLLNRNIAKKYGDDNSVHFILAVNRPELGLYFVDKMGNVLDRPVDEDDTDDYLVIGSGSESIDKFLENRINALYVDKDGITPGMAIKYAYEAIDRNEDIFTGGPVEIVTISKKGVQNYGPALRRSAKKAIRSELEKIIRENTN